MSVTIEEDFSDFDWDSTEGDQGQFPPVPEGQYPVRIAKAEYKTVEGKSGTFNKFALQLQILDGNPYAGRMFFDDIILNNKEGSRRRRAIIWRRLGLVQKGAQRASISEESLVGVECLVDVKVAEYTKRDGTKGTKNEVTFDGYKPLGDHEAASSGRPAGSAGQAPEASRSGDDGQKPLSESDCPF
jgi:hypothetical protein